ncbi:hypothetical protein C1645_47263 [Glomus cerebriforme]|uniref:Uncharacterized protein n=1 Tax=Glomus cerebriforme TaxID=658196 RepID=A0A397T8V8_9GLOM|nr:hypothetical protein C1645_47263 [Glomus cerebriforme]
MVIFGLIVLNDKNLEKYFLRQVVMHMIYVFSCLILCNKYSIQMIYFPLLKFLNKLFYIHHLKFS